jgi:hypothetical protein
MALDGASQAKSRTQQTRGRDSIDPGAASAKTMQVVDENAKLPQVMDEGDYNDGQGAIRMSRLSFDTFSCQILPSSSTQRCSWRLLLLHMDFTLIATDHVVALPTSTSFGICAGLPSHLPLRGRPSRFLTGSGHFLAEARLANK